METSDAPKTDAEVVLLSIRDSTGNHSDSTGNHFLKRERLARVPDSVLHSATLSLEAKAVYAELARHAFHRGAVYIGQRLMAKHLNTSQANVCKRIAELIVGGHVERTGDQIHGRRANYRLTSNIFLPLPRKPKPVRKRITETAKAAAWATSRETLDEILK